MRDYRDYMKALCCRFETTSRRAEYLDRRIERTYRQISRLLDEPERKLLLKMADLEDALREEACLNSFISGYRLAQGIQQELLADHLPYNFENEVEQRACELVKYEKIGREVKQMKLELHMVTTLDMVLEEHFLRKLEATLDLSLS